MVSEPDYSARDHGEEWWEPYHLIKRFSAKLKCANPTCGEIVFLTGLGELEDGVPGRGVAGGVPRVFRRQPEPVMSRALPRAR